MFRRGVDFFAALSAGAHRNWGNCARGRHGDVGTNGAPCPGMRRLTLISSATAAIVLAAAVVFAQQATVKPVATVKQIMQTMTAPLSDAVFSAASEPPKTDAQWAALRGTALALAESGKRLMIGPRAGDKAWMKMAQQQVDAAHAVTKTAGAKDADALSRAGDALYDTCASCHARYLNPKPHGS